MKYTREQIEDFLDDITPRTIIDSQVKDIIRQLLDAVKSKHEALLDGGSKEYLLSKKVDELREKMKIAVDALQEYISRFGTNGYLTIIAKEALKKIEEK